MINKNDIFGIYQIIDILEERSTDGHRLYLVKCLICNREFKLAANQFAYKSKILKHCNHLSPEESDQLKLQQWISEQHKCKYWRGKTNLYSTLVYRLRHRTLTPGRIVRLNCVLPVVCFKQQTIFFLSFFSFLKGVRFCLASFSYSYKEFSLNRLQSLFKGL